MVLILQLILVLIGLAFVHFLFGSNGKCNVGRMVCNSLQTGYNIREDHTGFGRTFSLGKTLYMLLLQFAFLSST